ncbi:tetratricopeptide repeat protein, partial [Myxococcota bacterium]|nr:tetratricopeptide repeat protein [Myxococcota bacterium]
MSKNKKHVLTKKELREDDVITAFFKTAWRKLKSIWKPITAGVVVIAIIIGAFYTFRYFQRRRNLKASRAFSTAISEFQRPLANADSKPGELIDGQKPVKDMSELYSASYGALSKALEECQSSRVCGLVKLVRGKVSLENARLNESQRATFLKKAIDDFESATKLRGFASALALESLGIAHEENGSYDKAFAVFHRLSVDYKDTFGGQAMLHKARILELQSKVEDAKKLYKEVVKLNPQ